MHINFRDIKNVSLKDTDNIANKIAVFLLKNMEIKESIEFNDLEIDNIYIAFILVIKLQGVDDVIVLPTNANWVYPIKKEEIISIINTKEIKIKHYESKLKEMWLLIVIDSVSDSGYLEVNNEEINGNVESSFNKVFLFKYPERVVYQLK